MSPPAVLVVHPDRVRLEELRAILSAGGYRVLTARTAELALECLSGLHVRLVVAAESLGDRTGMELLSQVRERSTHTALVLLGEEPDLENNPWVFGWLPNDVHAPQLLGVVKLAVREAELEMTARRHDVPPRGVVTL